MKRPIVILLTLILGLMLDLFPLSGALNALRPNWTLMIVMFWGFYSEERFSVGLAWGCGILMDLAQGSLIGMHALIFTLAIYLMKKHLLWIRSLTLAEQTILTIIIFTLQSLLTIWGNGILGIPSPSLLTWFGPIISSTLLWPLVSNLLEELAFILNLDRR